MMRESGTGQDFVRFQLPAILYAYFIFVVSSIPSTDFPDLSIFNYDKALHFLAYFGLSFLTYRAIRFQTSFPSLSKYALVISLLFAIGYGATDEYHQSFVPGRSSDPFDWLADSLGAGVCFIAIYVRSRVVPGATDSRR